MIHDGAAIPDDETENSMAAKPNYNFDKRQRDLAKKKKQDEKLAKKRAKSDSRNAENNDAASAPDAAPDSAPEGSNP
jgi:hypothetical protein